MQRWRPLFIRIVAVLALVGFCAAIVLWWWGRPQWTEERVQRAVVSTIQKEADAAFYVTGYLDVTVTSTVKNTEIFLPGLLDFPLGTATSTVRVPGRVYYGFDIEQLEAEDIRVREDGVIEVVLPELRVYATEPDLQRMEIQTAVGWRFYDDSRSRVERQAVGRVQDLLREQGAEHLDTSRQPRIHTAEALEKLLAPVLEAAGYRAPQLRFRIDDQLVMEPKG